MLRISKVLIGLVAGFTAALVLAPSGPACAEQTGARGQFVYVLRVSPRFQDETSWTDSENATVARHFDRLAKAAKRGMVILAGRTNESLDKTFGIVIFEADGEAAAMEFMEADPAVVAGLMVATLHPYSIALLRNQPALPCNDREEC